MRGSPVSMIPLQAAALHGCGITGFQADMRRFGSSPSGTQDCAPALKESKTDPVERDERAEGFIDPIEDLGEVHPGIRLHDQVLQQAEFFKSSILMLNQLGEPPELSRQRVGNHAPGKDAGRCFSLG